MTVTLRVDATASAPALVLRPWGADDVEPLIGLHRDPALRRWTQSVIENVEEGRRWLEVQRRGWETGARLSFAVDEVQLGTSEATLVGLVALKRPDAADGSAAVGYWTAADARGRGVAPRAVEAVTAWAFRTFAAEGPGDSERLERLELVHQVDNHASCRVAEKTGYRFHQVLPARPPFPRDGHLHVRVRAALSEDGTDA